MFSKSASKKLRQDFWIAFGKSYPHKWILYDTKIKGVSLKFHFDLKSAMVSIDIEHSDLEKRIEIWEKITTLRAIIVNDYLPHAQFESSFILDNQKEISRLYVKKVNVSIQYKSTWQEAMIFLKDNMLLFEAFFNNYRAII